MISPESKFSVLHALENIVLPAVRRGGMEKVFVAKPRWQKDFKLPDGMQLTRCSFSGERVAVRTRQDYGGSAVVDARWPQDKLESTRTPKFCFVLSGATMMRVGDYLLHTRPGHAVFLPPGTPFNDGTPFDYGAQPRARQSEPAQSDCELFILLPYRGGLSCWLSRRRCDEQGQLQITEESASIPHSQVPFYLERLSAEAVASSLHSREICDSLIRITMELLHRELQDLPVIRTGAAYLAADSSPIARREYSVAQAEEYIRLNLRETLSIDKVARHLCLSRTTFTTQFRAATGKTFAHYVTDLRFEEAEHLLRESDLSVHQLCLLVGLKPGRLRSLCQQHKGVSPAQFRLQSRQLAARRREPQ